VSTREFTLEDLSASVIAIVIRSRRTPLLTV
jgi:hypothetical protein